MTWDLLVGFKNYASFSFGFCPNLTNKKTWLLFFSYSWDVVLGREEEMFVTKTVILVGVVLVNPCFISC